MIVTSVIAEDVVASVKIKVSASSPEPTEAIRPCFAKVSVGFVATEAPVKLGM